MSKDTRGDGLWTVSTADQTPRHTTGVARAMADDNIAGEAPTILPANR